MRASAGIVLSASHNAFQDNGIKIFTASGYKLPDEAELKLENMLEEVSKFNRPTGYKIGRASRVDDAIGQYAVYLKEQFPKFLTLDGMRIVIDCANGASYRVAPKVFTELGAEVFLIGVEPNGKNINEQCGALHPQNLQERVMLYKADLGLAFDGDADRLVVVDENGDIVDGDEILALCGTRMLKTGELRNDTLVCTVMSNIGLEIALNKAGGKVIRTKVGDRYVMEAMRKHDLNLGGEQSGHLIFSDSATTGDGILAALHVLKIMLLDKKPISELRRSMKRMPQVLKNIQVKEKVPLEKLPKLAKLIKESEEKLSKKGRILFRYSGTESVARIMVEGKSKDQIANIAEKIANTTIGAIEEYGRKL